MNINTTNSFEQQKEIRNARVAQECVGANVPGKISILEALLKGGNRKVESSPSNSPRAKSSLENNQNQVPNTNLLERSLESPKAESLNIPEIMTPAANGENQIVQPRVVDTAGWGGSYSLGFGVWDVVGAVTAGVTQKVTDGVQYVKETASNSAQFVTEKTSNGVQFVAEKASNGVQLVTETASIGKQAAADYIRSFKADQPKPATTPRN